MAAIRYSRTQGFTLIELVAVIVLLGVVSVAVTRYITIGTQAYVDVMRRDATMQMGRYALERISRELRNALPGSVRVRDGSVAGIETHCVEFLPMVAASHYLDNQPIESNITQFQAADFPFVAEAGVTYYAAIYALVASDVYAAGAPGPALQRLSAANPVDAAVANQRAINLAAAGSFAEHSPLRRVMIARAPVSFCAQAGRLTRHTGYGFAAVQPLLPNAGALLSETIQLNDGGAVYPFQFSPGTLQRAGVVHLDLRFLVAGTSGEWVRFSHDVGVRNAP